MKGLLSVHMWKYLGTFSTSQLVAQAAGGATADPYVDTLLKGGPFAIVLLLIILDKIGTHGERDRLRLENTALREEIKELNADLRNDVLPPLTGIASGLPGFTKVLDRVVNVLDRVEVALQKKGAT